MANPSSIRPFAGGECFVTTPLWEGVAKQLAHLAQFSGGLQVVEGDRGAGKTVFAHYLHGLLPKEATTEVLALPAGLPTAQVFECIQSALLLPLSGVQSIGQAIMSLRQLDANLKREAKRKILIMDDAHHLEDQALGALASLFQGSDSTDYGLALILVGAPGTAQRLDALHLVDVEVRDSLLPPFSLAESRVLLVEEFGATSGQPFPFDEDLVAALWNESQGRPGDMLQLAQLAYDDMQARQSRLTRQGFPLWHIVAILLLAAVLLVGYWLRQSSPSSAPAPVFTFPASSSESSVAATVSSSGAAVMSNANLAHIAAPNTNNSLANTNPLANNNSPVNSDTLVNNDTLMTNNTLIRSHAADGAASSERALSAHSMPSQSSSGGAASSQAPGAAVTQPLGGVTQHPSAPVASTKTPARPPLPATPKVAQAVQSLSLSADEAALLKMRDGGFVLQIMAANSQSALQQFVASQPNRRNLKIYRTLRAGKQWFVVVEGYYADKNAAAAAVRNLPAGQLQAGPWPKSINAVKLEITAKQQQQSQ
jgi:DamX protein